MNLSKTWLKAGMIALAILSLALLAAAPTAHADGRNHGSDSPHIEAGDRQMAEQWAEWFLEIPANKSPLTDPDGRFCHVGQDDDVLNLGSNFGGESVRSCTVRQGTPVVASPGGAFCVQGIDGDTKSELRDCAIAGLAGINVSAQIDGNAVHLGDYVVTNFVTIHLPKNNILELPAGKYKLIFASYIFEVSRLSVGQHVIKMHNDFPDGFSSDVIYNLTVKRDH